MTELITWLERQIELCDDIKNMEKEKWAFIQTLKKVRKEAISVRRCCTELCDDKGHDFDKETSVCKRCNTMHF